MLPPVAMQEWIDRFVIHLKLRWHSTPVAALSIVGRELWPLNGHLSPEAVAQTEYDDWPTRPLQPLPVG